MRIQDLLENTEEIDPNVLSAIINSKFFELNWKSYFDNSLKSKDNTNLMYYPDTMLHGGKIKPNKIYDIKPRSKPSDSSPIIHMAINQIAEKELNAPVRNFLFSSTSDVVSSEYGTLAIIVPLDEEYQLYYSTLVDDMFTSEEVFNNEDFRENILFKKLPDFFKQQEAKDIINKIASYYEINKGQHSPNMLIKSLIDETPFSQSMFITSIMNSKNNIDKTINKFAIEDGSQEIVDMLSSTYSEKNNINKDELEELTRSLSLMILKYELSLFKKWIIKDAKRYVDSIKVSKVLTTMESDFEIMSTPGKYATLPIRGGLQALYDYYRTA